jgi:NAD(P)-dependent dehydrogenase (short-subunit alcohol dehydrogenase family)
MKVLAGKTALVTGAASGIGRAIALRLAKEQVRLHLIDVDEAGLARIKRELCEVGCEVATYRCDLRNAAEISETLGEILAAGGVDLLVNNAGVGYCGPTHEMSAEQWNRVLSINLHAPLQIVRELLPSLLARPESHIVNMSSMLGLFAGAKAAAYSVSKFGLQGLSESLRAEYGRGNLGVTAICPGFAHTGILDAARRAGSPQEPKGLTKWFQTTPEHIAERTISAIRGNRPLVVISPLAHFLWFCKRLAPSLFLRLFTSRYRAPKPAVGNASPGTKKPSGAISVRQQAAA